MKSEISNRSKVMESVDAETLLSTPMGRTEFIVDGLIPRGLTVLAGPSKSGKSWMMMWLALKVAGGEELWGLKTHRCGVLYISLEDTMARARERLDAIAGKEAPVELRVSVDAAPMGSGFEEQVMNHMAAYPGTKLIIVDTLQKIRKSNSSSTAGMYATDYEDISRLKKLADELDIAIVLVHHLRKMKDESDPFNDITGSTGIMGAADSCLLLRSERGKKEAKLLATGRDIEYQELSLKHEDDSFIWELVSRKGPEKLRQEKVHPFVQRVVEFMKPQVFWTGSSAELLEAMGEKELNCRIVPRLLARYADSALTPIGMTYETGRTYQGRYINLIHKDPEIYNEDGSLKHPRS